MLHIVLLDYFNHLYSLASCKGFIVIYKLSCALGKTLFLLIMFLSTFTCLSSTIYCVHSFNTVHNYLLHMIEIYCLIIPN